LPILSVKAHSSLAHEASRKVQNSSLPDLLCFRPAVPFMQTPLDSSSGGLTLGRAVSGLNAQAKGRRLGIFKPHEEKPKKAREEEPGERYLVDVLGRPVPAKNTDDGIRAVRGKNPIDPDSVRRYLENKFGDDLKAVQSAMQKLAKAYKPQQLGHDAYSLHERFRPEIPACKKGWGAKGNLDLGLIGRLAKEKP
jgi:hypothetical protein